MTGMRTLDDLPILPKGIVVQEFSSRNKTGANGDAGWFLYRDEHGDAVIFDAVGPGCIKSMWGTAIPENQTLKFYFDGEVEPRYVVKTKDFYEGKHPLLPAPLASFMATGRYEGIQYSGNCFAPIPFEKSLVIAVEGEMTFHHILCERYPFDATVKSFDGTEDRARLLDAFARPGEELSPNASDETAVSARTEGIPPGGALDLFSLDQDGVIRRIVLEGDGSEEFLRNVEIELRWDDAKMPDVIAPVGMLFSCPMRAESVKSLPIAVEKRADGELRLEIRFRMPFWRNAKGRLVNRGSLATGPVSAEARIAPQTYAEETTGYFRTQYRAGRTVMGRDWPFYEGIGTGWFVGAVQTMLGGHYCEGDEHFTIDGAGMPQINGTGTEDYYLACFWPNVNFNLPFSGCVGDAFAEGGGFYDGAYRRTGCYYRFHLEAPIPFYSRIDAKIQHGGASDIVSHYSSLGFAYQRDRPALTQTDFLDVGNPESERAHGYSATDGELTGDLTASYEGENLRTAIRDRGRRHRGGEIRFNVGIRPDNDGARLRLRLDQSQRRSAEVYANGQRVGTWRHPDENPHLRWHDSDFDIPARFAKGEEKLEIRLVLSSEGEFADFRYEAFVFEPRQ